MAEFEGHVDVRLVLETVLEADHVRMLDSAMNLNFGVELKKKMPEYNVERKYNCSYLGLRLLGFERVFRDDLASQS